MATGGRVINSISCGIQNTTTYVSKFTAASPGSPCDNTAVVYITLIHR